MKTVALPDMNAVPPLGRRLRVAVLNRQFSATGGGAERYSIALVERLADRHEIHVFAQHIEHQWPGVTYHTVSQWLKRPRWLNQLWYAGVTWWATRTGFDVVHSHENTWHGNVQTLHVPPVKYNLFHGKSGMRMWLRWLKVITSPRLLVYLWFERQRLASGRPGAIVLASSSLTRQMVQAYPACDGHLLVVTPGVAQVAGAADAGLQHAARRHLGLPLTGRCVLLVGHDYRKKGLTALISALALLPIDCYLAVVGNARQIPHFRAMAEAGGLALRVFFLGPRKDMGDVYAAADCLAHPTLEDTFAMVVLEAMAHGLPVVASVERYCGIAGLLIHEFDAWLLEDPTDAEALADALRRILDDQVLRRRLVGNGLAFAHQHSWATASASYDAIYDDVVRRSVS